MAKKSAKKKSYLGLILNIAIIVFAVLTVCTLFMNVAFQTTIATDAVTAEFAGKDLLSAMFQSEINLENSGAINTLIVMKAAEETAFVTTVFMWLYLITLIVSVASLVFAVLNILGLKFKLVNTILGISLAVLAVLTFIFAIIFAGKFTDVNVVLGKEIGTKGFISVGIYMLVATIIGGGIEVYNAKRK